METETGTDEGSPTEEGSRPGSQGFEPEHITTSTRHPKELGRRLEGWLAGLLPHGSAPTVTDVASPEGNGMSSETLLFTMQWRENGERHERRCVARIEPPPTAYPVFPVYDLDMQYRVMELVGRATDVPVPETLWFEPDTSVLGVSFFVMALVNGLVPPDVLPYTFGDNWVFDASAEDSARLQASTIRAIAGIHAVTPETHDLAFLDSDPTGALPSRPTGSPAGTGSSSLARHVDHWRAYHDWVVGDSPSPLLTDCFAWLDANMPTDVGEPALSWGDSRIGNMMFEGSDVVAVLDWEMAAVAPPEVDLGWLCYLHMFFQDLAVELGAEGLPDMFRPADVVAAYAKASGHVPGNLKWHIAYAAMRHGVIMRRVTERAVFFGEAVQPDDIDDLIMHRSTLRAMLDGSYWSPRGL